MIIECPNCNKKFNIDKKLIPENGRTLKCSSCDHIWHYKTPVIKNIDDVEKPQDKNTNLDTYNSEVEKKDDDNNKDINDGNFTDKNHESLYEKNRDDVEDEEDDIIDEKENEEKQGKIKMVLVYFILVIISLLGLLFLLDTFKSYLISVFPTLTPFFDSFYETLLDFKLFIKDLAN